MWREAHNARTYQKDSIELAFLCSPRNNYSSHPLFLIYAAFLMWVIVSVHRFYVGVFPFFPKPIHT